MYYILTYVSGLVTVVSFHILRAMSGSFDEMSSEERDYCIAVSAVFWPIYLVLGPFFWVKDRINNV